VRYLARKIIRNRFTSYRDLFEDRDVGEVRHYATPRLRHPTSREIGGLARLTHIWKVGDRYYKLAHKHYGNAKYWWVIAWYNKRPTESHVRLGETIYVPSPLEEILRIFRV